MKPKHLTMMFLALPALSLAATPVAANCDNYGNQVHVGTNDTCTVNYQYCDQGSGAGAGAGAGGPSGSNGASANAGTGQGCNQNSPPPPPGGCSDATARMVRLADAFTAQGGSDPTVAASSVDPTGIIAAVSC
jgi:hypothetical protein